MSAAPRFTTADIAKGTEAAERERLERERVDAANFEQTNVLADRERADAIAREQERETAQAENVQPENAMTPGAPARAEQTTSPLFETEAAQGFRTRWDAVQASFVDDPRRAVQEADALVAETMQRLADTFAKERARLEQQFDRNTNVSTEDLRVTLRHYRSFFTRLLTV
jgi:hypothetical protein